MNEQWQQYAVNAVSSPKGAVSVAVGSIGTGAGAYFEYLTPIVGFFAALAGLGLSVTLIVAKIINTWQGFRLNNLKIKALKQEKSGGEE